jgi:hypothetical protein
MPMYCDLWPKEQLCSIYQVNKLSYQTLSLVDTIGEFSWTLVDNVWVNCSGHFLGEL